MKLIENREKPIPVVNPLQTLTIELTRDDVWYIQMYAHLDSFDHSIKASFTAFQLIKAIKKVEL